jgi:hypothetical protein
MRSGQSQDGAGDAGTLPAGPARLTGRGFRPRGAGGAANMQDISVLTPPLLMCAAVLVAIGMFLRHEMRRGRTDDGQAEHESLEAEVEAQDFPEAPPISGSAPSGKNHASADSSVDDGER